MRRRSGTATLVAALVVAAWTAPDAQPDYDAKAAETMRSSFRTRGQASVERLTQDEVQAACTKYRDQPPGALAAQLREAQARLVKYPADGRYLGDWKEGERIAQTGVGKQWSDDPARPAGGNCYACHQLAPRELSFGTIGPSLYRYGKLRGTGEPVLRYTWAKLWNSQASSTCSNMPRFGHSGILTEEQLRHLMALLLDPQSPVNQ